MQNRLDPRAPNIELALGSGDATECQAVSRSALFDQCLRSQPRFQTQFSCRRFCVLAARSLVRDPLADVGRAIPELDAFSFGLSQKLHSVAVHQLYLREFDSDDTASVERSANDLQIFRSEPTADVKEQTLLSRNVGRFGTSLARVACRPLIPMANGVPFECD